MSGFRVTYEEGRWTVTAPNGAQTRCHPSQQIAISWAKRRALVKRTTVEWTDREGNPQGRVSYEMKKT